MSGFPESDWKVFRELNPIVYDRLCQRILANIRAELDRADASPHEKLASIRQALRDGKDETNLMFDRFSRSAVDIQLIAMFTRKLLTPAEIARFSPQTQARLVELTAR